jgi:protein TonB
VTGWLADAFRTADMTEAHVTPRDRLAFTLFLALALHAAFILGITFSADTERAPSSVIEVTLTRYSEAEAPEQADFIAATHQHGSGSADEVLETTARRETDFQSPTPTEAAPTPQPQEANPRDEREVLSSIARSETRVAREAEQITEEVTAPTPRQTFAFDSLAREIASLEARIAEEQQAQANRPRVKRLTSVSARSATEAGYLNAWRQRVERIGTANYPGGGIDGSLRMLVVVRFDGALEDVRILESSGHRVLDDAALRIVRLAAPFPAFPVEMRKDYDQLEIIRTWQFSRTGARLDG